MPPSPGSEMSSHSSTTSFSSFRSPRPAPSPPMGSSTSSQRSSLRKMVSESCISLKGFRLQADKVKHDPYAWHLPQGLVRRGYVGVQRDKLRSWSWTRRVWLVLDDKWLYICPREDSIATHTLSLTHVRLLEPVTCRRFCLVVATSSQTWYLLLKDIIALHAWFYDIHMRCPLLQISMPTDFRHEMHVAYDAAAGEITGLPESWIETLWSWGIGPRFSNSFSHVMESTILSPMTEPATSPVSNQAWRSLDTDKPLPVPEVPLYAGRQRSASAAAAPSTAPSIVQSVDQFRRSPNRYRDINARDLTGAVQPINLLPTSRTETCDIWKAEWSGTFGKRKVAIQVIRLPGVVSEGEQTQLSSITLREINALHQLRHPNVVRTRGFCRDQGPLPALVSTWVPQGNIMTYLEYHRPNVGKGPRLKFLSEVAAGVNYLHNFSRKIVHGNLCGTHILISEHGNACISGFGLNPILQEMGTPTDPVNTVSSGPSPRWAAMEVIRLGRRHVTTSSDVFSFARTVVEVMTGKDPFYYTPDDAEVIQAVVRGVLPRRHPVFGEDGLWPFLERCWMEEPAQRPSMTLALLRMEEIQCFYHDPEKEPPNSA